MKDNKHNFSSRCFLNKGVYHSLAAISCSVVLDEEEFKKGSYWSFEGDFHISNCDRSLSLEINLSNSEDLENSIHKIKQIEQVCGDFKKHLESLREKVKQLESNREESQSIVKK